MSDGIEPIDKVKRKMQEQVNYFAANLQGSNKIQSIWTFNPEHKPDVSSTSDVSSVQN